MSVITIFDGANGAKIDIGNDFLKFGSASIEHSKCLRSTTCDNDLEPVVIQRIAQSFPKSDIILD